MAPCRFGDSPGRHRQHLCGIFLQERGPLCFYTSTPDRTATPLPVTSICTPTPQHPGVVCSEPERVLLSGVAAERLAGVRAAWQEPGRRVPGAVSALLQGMPLMSTG